MILVPDLKTVENTATSRAEVSLARLLASVEGPSDAVAFHSVRLRSHAYKQQAEIDFVVLWKRTVIVVEVKGGGVRRHEGRWYSIDRHDDWHALSSSPMEQARSGMYALGDILREEGVGWFPRESMVVTPDIEEPPNSVEWKAAHWLAGESMTTEGLRRCLDAVVAGAAEPPARQRRAGIDELRGWLFGEFARVPVFDAIRGAVLEEQAKATEGQARVVAGGALNDRMLVIGGAGTGKSLALASLARQESMLGRAVLVTFKSRSLSRMFEKLLVGHEVDVRAFDDLEANREYDVVLIDEAQDLMHASAMDRIDSAIAGGRGGGRWRMFMDPNNQAHVEGAFDEDVLALVHQECAVFELQMNVRNTRAIVHVIQQYLGADIGDPAIVHGERVNWHDAPSGHKWETVAAVAQQLYVEGVARDQLWVIPVCGAPVSSNFRERFEVRSPQEAKGLEADHVVVCALPDDLTGNSLAAFYVAATRARVGLHLVIEPDERKYLQKMIRQQGA